MTREFVMTPSFDKDWKGLGLSDTELVDLQLALVNDPLSGDVMEGTGGVRKLRIALSGRGKSGGARVIYVDFAFREVIFLLAVYPKNERDNLSKAERNDLKQLMDYLKQTLK